jgi:GT2 family glycosyltransferase
VAAQTRRPDRVIVVDNHSTDGTSAVAERVGAAHRLPIAVLPQSSNVGFPRANNIGVAALDGCDGVALLNPDAFPEPGWPPIPSPRRPGAGVRRGSLPDHGRSPLR